MPGILVDTLLRTASCGDGSVVDRPNLSIEFPKMADPRTFKTYVPPRLPPLFQRETGVWLKRLVGTLPTAQLLGPKVQSSAKLYGYFSKLQ
jgi:hypothetical protein